VKRRTFITLLGGVAATWPLAARAQQPGRLPTIGFLGAGTPSTDGAVMAAFSQRLRELGWIEGRTAAIEIRWAEGRNERAAEIAAEFVRLKVDIIVASSFAHIMAAKQATSLIPIVFPVTGDPVATGLVASLARPGGNVTGLSVQATELAGKRNEILREVVPGLHRLAIMANAGNPNTVLQMGEAQAAARTLGLEVLLADIRQAQDIDTALEGLKGRADGLYVHNDPFTLTNRLRISTVALAAGLPTTYGAREHVEAGGLMSYAPNFVDLHRRAAQYVDKILRGAKPADLPVEQPTKFDLVVNLTTAKALGLTISESFLVRADEVIE
jgi:putative ABC transport system substrate-binding protein